MTQHPDYQHQQLNHQTSSQESNHYSFIIYSDGSGYHEHFGGYGAVIVSTDFPDMTYVPVVGACTHTEVGRAEMLGMLSALWAIVDTMQWDKSRYHSALKIQKPSVLIVTDREDMAGSVNGVYQRRRNPDLWRQFSWFEEHFDISAQHVKRETNRTQSIADKLASEARLVLKDFYKSQQDTNHI